MMLQVFLSHSSKDKPFVRDLADAISNAGYSVWLDEKELIAGDPLASKIGQAIDKSEVVLVVVSVNSAQSNWLKHELNHATNRMVNGLCRLIPVVIDDSDIPPEVSSLLYADFRQDPGSGLKAVMSAIDHEYNLRNPVPTFWTATREKLEEIFGPIEHIFTLSEYRSKDYELLTLFPDSETVNGEGISSVLEVIESYTSREKALTESWLYEYLEEAQSYYENVSVVVSARSCEFNSPRITQLVDRVDYVLDEYNGRFMSLAVFIDLSGEIAESEINSLFEKAYDFIRTKHKEVYPERIIAP